MNETTRHLAIAFGTLGGILFVLLSLSLSRFYFVSRKQRKLRMTGQASGGVTYEDEKDGWWKRQCGWLLKPGKGLGGTR